MDSVVHDVEHPGEQEGDPSNDEGHMDLMFSQETNSAVHIHEAHVTRDIYCCGYCQPVFNCTDLDIRI